MGISEQVNALRKLAEERVNSRLVYDAMLQAADTIESLYAKLQAANMESDLIKRESVLKLIEDIKCNPDLPKNYGTLLDIMREVRGIPAAYDVENIIKANMERSAEDCGGWIPCSTGNMPDIGSTVLIQFKSDMDGITGDDDRTFDISYIRSGDNSEWFCSTGKYPLEAIKAWKPIKSYHEP